MSSPKQFIFLFSFGSLFLFSLVCFHTFQVLLQVGFAFLFFEVRISLLKTGTFSFRQSVDDGFPFLRSNFGSATPFFSS